MSHAFEFTPLGIRPAGQGPVPETALEEPAAPVVVRRRAEPAAPAASPVQAAQRPVIDASAPLDGKALLKQVRDRVKTIKRELAKVPALHAELAALERLLAAAKSAPKSNVLRIARGA